MLVYLLSDINFVAFYVPTANNFLFVLKDFLYNIMIRIDFRCMVILIDSNANQFNVVKLLISVFLCIKKKCKKKKRQVRRVILTFNSSY